MNSLKTTSVLICLAFINLSCTLSGKTFGLDSQNQDALVSEEHFREHSVNMPSVLKIYSADRKPAKQVSGLCFVTAGSNSFFELPCVGVYISLLDKNEKIILKVKTDEKGRFRFTGINLKETYHLGVVSEGYKTLSEKVYVSAGTELLLELVEKKRDRRPRSK